MAQSFWAVMPMPTDMRPHPERHAQAWTLEAALRVCRIEKAPNGIVALERAFEIRPHPKGHPLAKYDVGVWLVKEIGDLKTVRSDSKRIAALRSTDGWVDPFADRAEQPGLEPLDIKDDRSAEAKVRGE